MNRRFFIGFFAGALAALATPFKCLNRHPDLVTRKLCIYRPSMLGDFEVWRGIGGLHPFKDARAGDFVKVVSDSNDPMNGKVLKVVEGPAPTEDPYTQGSVKLVIEEYGFDLPEFHDPQYVG